MIEDNACTIPDLYTRTIGQNIPFSTIFELTYRCNLRCRQCYIVPENRKELGYDEITGILDQLAAANTLFLTLTGGEIMMRGDFLDIARYAKNKGFALKLFSNGTLIDEAAAARIAEIHPISVGISIYGAEDETHEYYTREPGSFQRSIQSLRYLRESGVKTVMKILVMKRNAAQMTAMLDLARKLDAIPQADVNIAPKNNGDIGPLAHRISDDQLYNFYYNETRKDDTNTQHRYNADSIMCRAARDVCAISPYGDVYPCVSLPLTLGNLRENRFGDIWQGEKAEIFRGYRFKDLRDCQGCIDMDHCLKCWGFALLEAGDLLAAPDSNCRIARIRHRVSKERGKIRG